MTDGYFIGLGDKTTCGGKVLDGDARVNIYGLLHAREGDRVSCGKDGKTYRIVGGISHMESHGKLLAGTLDSFSDCPCRARLIPSVFTASYQNEKTSPQSARRAAQPASSTVTSPSVAPRQSSFVPSSHPASAVFNRVEPQDVAVSIAPTNGCVFAKTCTVPPDSTEAGTGIEPVANFGQTMVMASTAIASTEGGAALGRVAGQAALETLGTWSLRGAAAAAGTAASTLLLALWPTSMGTSTLTEEQLRGMMVAPTRVRFQFRRDADGIMRVYGIHTSATSGMDSVPVVGVDWNKDRSAMEAKLNGITIIWTPNNGPVVQAPTTYPGVTDALNNILVHPVAEDIDTQIEIYPASDDLTWQDCILVFPVGSGVPPLYLVFAKPAVNPLEVGLYGSFDGRPRNGTHLDHMPSQKALAKYLRANDPGLLEQDIQKALRNAASIAIPAKVHQKYSETYGGRNSKTKQIQDAADLRAAVDRNFLAIKPYLLEEGFSDTDLETARADMHKLNEEQGWY